MTSPDQPQTTRFMLNLPGFTVELVGDRSFVEDLYRKISRDLSPILAAAAEGRTAPPTTPSNPADGGGRPAHPSGFTWVYLCTNLFNKVYVVENATVESTILGRYVDGDRVRRVYLDRDETALFTGLTSGNRTLWAEFTNEGRALLQDTLARTHREPK